MVMPVVIVGAGPTGIAAATLLARYGVATLVLDRFPRMYPLPRGVHLDDEVVRILQRLGVADAFIRISRPGLGLRLLDARHRVMAEFRRDEPEGPHGYPQANMFDQPDLERLLRDNLANFPRVRLLGGMEVTDLEQLDGSGPVLVTYRDVATGAVHHVRAAAVLGCDGANSTVRELIGARLEDLRFEERWLVVDVSLASELNAWAGVHQVCDPRRAATFMQIGADRYRWEFRLRDGESAAGLTDGDGLGVLLAPWIGDLRAADVRVIRQAEYTFRARLADRWRRGRVFLLGDAAHLTPPFIGQGLGAGLRDAYNLAWKLALVLPHGADERLLDSYEAERGPHARAQIRLAVTAGWAMTGGRGPAAALRRIVLGIGFRLPGVRRLALRGTSPSLSRGPLVHKRRWRRDLAGSICPQPWIDREDGRRRLDDVLGRGFAVLVDGPPDARLAALARRLDATVVQLSTTPAASPDSAASPDIATSPDRAVAVVDSEALRRWMSRGRAGAVLLRPDRVVLADARPGWRLGARLTRRSAALLSLLPDH